MSSSTSQLHNSAASSASSIEVGNVDGVGSVRVGDPVTTDCNENGVEDACDIQFGTSTDNNMNGIPDDCECDVDRDNDADADINDLLDYLSNWFQGCPGDG